LIAAIGVDVGGTRVRLLAVDASGAEVAGTLREQVWCGGEEEPTPERLGRVIASLAADAGLRLAAGMPLGVGFAGQLSRDGRVVRNAPNLGWRDVALADRLAAALGLDAADVVVVNDLKAILRGEMAAGAARGVSEVLAVYVGTGVGGAFATGGRLVLGAGGNAGEVGHVKVPGNPAVCGCGEVGCVESIAGGAALLRHFAAESAAGRLAHLGASPTIADIDAAALRGDAAATREVERIELALAPAVANACTLLNPELLLLGGGVLDHAPGLVARLHRRIGDLTLAVSRANLRFAGGQLGTSAGSIGAAAAARDRTAA
jgi:glucokinase